MQNRKIPLRMCMGCREMKPKRELLRVVKTQSGDICLDKTGKMAGRGAYVCADKSCFEKVKKQHSFDKTFSVKVSDEIINALEGEITNE